MIRTQVDHAKITQAFARLPRAVRFQFGDALDHISLKFLKLWRSTRLQGPPGVTARPHGIFTQFKRVMSIPSGDAPMGVEIFTESKVAKLQEEGGTVTNPGGGKLAVPLSARSEMFTASGALRKNYKRIGNLKNIRPIKFNGQTYLSRVKKKTREVTPLFVMKQSVKIEPRLGFYQTWETLEPEALKIVDKAIGRAAREAWSA